MQLGVRLHSGVHLFDLERLGYVVHAASEESLDPCSRFRLGRSGKEPGCLVEKSLPVTP